MGNRATALALLTAAHIARNGCAPLSLRTRDAIDDLAHATPDELELAVSLLSTDQRQALRVAILGGAA